MKNWNLLNSNLFGLWLQGSPVRDAQDVFWGCLQRHLVRAPIVRSRSRSKQNGVVEPRSKGAEGTLEMPSVRCVISRSSLPLLAE